MKGALTQLNENEPGNWESDALGAASGGFNFNVGPALDTAGFLKVLYGSEAPGHLVLWTKQDNRAYWYLANDLERAAAKARNLSQFFDVYFGVGLQDREATEARLRLLNRSNTRLSRLRGTAETVVAIPGLWVDIDVRSKAHARPNLPPTVEDALDLLKAFPLQPSLIISTGHGIHAYWLFRELLVIDNKEERDEIQDLLRRFQETLRAIAGRRGWEIDNTSDLARVLRLPGTSNRKEEPAVPVQVAEYNKECRYNPSEFEEYLVDDASGDPYVEPTDNREMDPCSARIEPIVDGCRWIRHCRDDAAYLSEPEWYALLSILGRCAHGEQLAHEWSAPYPGYSPQKTSRKLAHALEAAGPRTCRNIRQLVGDTYCNGCPSWGKITSPIVLGTRTQVPEGALPPLSTSQDNIVPFPVQVFPLPLRQFVEQGSKELHCPPDFIAVPLLVFCGVAIGKSRVLQIKTHWHERGCLYAAVVGDPGSKKSPALKLASQPMRRRQALLLQEYKKALKEYEQELKEYEENEAKWKRDLKDGIASPADRPERPEKPVPQQVIVSDTTMEALAVVHSNNPRGLVLVRDELSGWVRSMNQYKQGKGDDQQKWLSINTGEDITINRKNSQEPITIEEPFVSVIGCLPPDVLGDLAIQQGREDGFIDRILFTYPPAMANEWTDYEMPSSTLTDVGHVFDRLWELQPQEVKDGHPKAVVLHLTPAARRKWVEWYTEHCREQDDGELPERLCNVWAKFYGYCARFALIIHVCRLVCGEATDENVDEASMDAAILLAEYFKSHAKRVHARLHSSPQDKLVHRATKWIARHGGTATVREMQRSNIEGLKKATDVERLFHELEDRGYGVVEMASPARGKRSLRFRLTDCSTHDN